jgi:hypothetical protein
MVKNALDKILFHQALVLSMHSLIILSYKNVKQNNYSEMGLSYNFHPMTFSWN